jgi:uncharacterized protein (TIGR02145 family)
MQSKIFFLAALCLVNFTSLLNAQTPLQYQLNQQGAGNCPGTPVNISISTGAGISTTAVSAILSNSALSGGNIGNDGGNAITQRGVCWSTTPNPTTANSISSNGSGLGSYSSNLTGLSPNTLYYVRAYAINSVGTFYGNEVSFTTAASGSISALNCGLATNAGTLISGTPANGVSCVVPYTGGDGGLHNGQTVTSTGVTGLTATLAAGTFANGAGNLTYTITGTPNSSGTASFALNIGGQSCSLNLNSISIGTYPTGSVFCNSLPTAVVDVTNPITGKTWMDRNLGASQAATSSTDVNAYGDLYQWGRRADGHQCRNSLVTNILSSTDQPLHGDFIIGANNAPDWIMPQNNNLWQGVNGVNNPCPIGYRLPTYTEIEQERLSWSFNSSFGAFSSPLKLPLAGFRNVFNSSGVIEQSGSNSWYWSSTISGTSSFNLQFVASAAGVYSGFRSSGNSVRCIKN